MKNKWLVGARLKTLPAAIVPVLVGTAGANRDLLNKSINLNLFVYARSEEHTSELQSH